MNVNKIQILSKQHGLLKSFHGACNGEDVELKISKAGCSSSFDEVLDYNATKSIIVEVRRILLKRLLEVKEEIKKEASDG